MLIHLALRTLNPYITRLSISALYDTHDIVLLIYEHQKRSFLKLPVCFKKRLFFAGDLIEAL